MRRQAAVLAAGGTVVQETRHFHEAGGTTSPGRRKETAEDYRYFPEPDLVPIAPSAEWVERAAGDDSRAAVAAPRAGIQAEWGISDEVMRDLVNAGAVELVDGHRRRRAPPAEARAWWVAFLVQKANEARCRARRAADHAGAGGRGDRAGRRRQADQQAGPPGRRRRAGRRGRARRGRGRTAGWPWSPTTRAMQAAVDEALAAKPDVAEKIRGGKVQAAGAIVGAVMKATRGQADAARVRELVHGKGRRLSGPSGRSSLGPGLGARCCGM